MFSFLFCILQWWFFAAIAYHLLLYKEMFKVVQLMLYQWNQRFIPSCVIMHWPVVLIEKIMWSLLVNNFLIVYKFFHFVCSTYSLAIDYNCIWVKSCDILNELTMGKAPCLTCVNHAMSEIFMYETKHFAFVNTILCSNINK